MQDKFLERLYKIQPFKVVDSPESLKKRPISMVEDPTHIGIVRKFSDNLADHHHTPDKENSHKEGIVQSEMFTNLSSSIDNLFSKIERIKEEFDYQLSGSAKKNNSMRRGTPVKEVLVETTNFNTGDLAREVVKEPELEAYARPVQSMDLN